MGWVMKYTNGRQELYKDLEAVLDNAASWGHWFKKDIPRQRYRVFVENQTGYAKNDRQIATLEKE